MFVSWTTILVNPFLNFIIACTYDLGWIRIDNLLYGILNIF